LTIEVTGDTHLDGIPILREINTVLRVLLPIMNVYMFLETRKKRYLFLCLIAILVPLSRGSRSTFFNSFLIILTLIFRKVNFKKILIISTIILTLIISGISLGNYRRIYTTREYGFEVGIFGDFFNNNLVGNIFSWYYGYYSLSFYNLSSSINNWVQNPNHYLGLTNLNGLLAYFFDNYPSQSEFNYSVTSINGAANVPTAFYYYIVDFGILGAVIFDFVFYSILFYFYKKSLNDNFYRLVYCLLLFNILNFIFYSSFYAVYLYPIILFLIVFRFLYIRKYEDNTVANFSFNDNI
jgi:oligosaccharide repeat unit polymerase